jgi:hypothetical protein
MMTTIVNRYVRWHDYAQRVTALAERHRLLSLVERCQRVYLKGIREFERIPNGICVNLKASELVGLLEVQTDLLMKEVARCQANPCETFVFPPSEWLTTEYGD